MTSQTQQINHLHGAAQSADGLAAQLQAVLADPTGNLPVLLVGATVIVLVGCVVFSVVGRLILSSTGSSSGFQGSGDGGFIAFAAPKVAVLVVVAALPSLAFTPFLEQAKAAVMQILGGS